MTGFSNDLVFNDNQVVPERVTVRGTVKSMHMRQHDVIKTADWVLDLGPGGGVNGGRIIAEGPPERIIEEPTSATGQYLGPLLERSAVKPVIADTPSKPRRRSRKVNADEPDLIPAK